MTTADIGAARVHLIVDTEGVDKGIAQAKNSMQGFGSAAERAFDQSSAGVRRATNRIADYIAGLKSVDGQLERNLRQLARLGADEAIIKSLAQSWREVRSEVDSANDAFEEASRINAAFNKNRIDLAQREISSLVGVNPADAAESARRRADAEAALLPLLQRQEAELQRQLQLANQIAIARQQAATEEAQRGFNSTLGINDVDPAAAARRRADAEAAIVPLLQQQERELQAQVQLSNQIASARQQAAAEEAQRRFNSQLGIVDRSGDLGYLMQQRSVVASLTQQFQQMDTAIDQAFAQNRQADAFIQQLRNMQEAAGKTHYEMLQLQAARLGISQQAAPLIQGIQAQNEAMGRGTLTAKQYEFAMRGLPAQITDIVVSLASGQPVYMVALQQGGQLKDMFGGIGQAAKALGTSLWALVTPWSALAVAMAGVVYASYDASRSLEQLSIATAKGFGIAGTAEELYGLADALTEIDGVRLGKAEEAISRLAQSGKLTEGNFNLAAAATARWASLTGEAVDGLASKFEEIAKDPLRAIEAGQVRVTEAQYEHVKALVDSGNQQQAVNELTRIFYDTINNNSSLVESHLTGVSRLLQGIKSEFGEATRGIGNFFNDMAGYYVNVTQAGQDLRDSGAGFFATRIGMFDRSNWRTPGGTEPTGALYDPDEAKRIKEREDATEAWLATADKEAGRRIALNKIREEGIKLGQSEAQIEAVQARQRAEWAKADSGRSRAPSGRDTTQMIRDQLTTELASLQTQQKATEISYQQRGISVEQYYDKLLEYATRERDLTIQSNDQQIAALAGKRDAERQISTLRANSARAEESYAQRKMELDAAESNAERQRNQAYADSLRVLQQRTEAVTRDMAAQVAAVSTGGRQIEIQQRINELYRDQTNQLYELSKEYEDGARDTEIYEKRKQDVIRETAAAINEVITGYQRLDDAQGNAMNGVTRAYQDFAQQTKDVASTVYGMTTTVFSGIGDAAANMATKGKASFKDMADSILADIMRLGTNKMLMALLGSVTGGGGYTGTLGTLFGGSWGFAKGGVPGGEALGAYRNQIVSKPTFFPFAKGGVPNMGLMGEAGAEAIMPLRRDSNGRLGVSAEGQGRGIPKIVVNAIGVDSQPEVSASMGADGTLTIDALFGQFEGRMAERMGSGVGPMAAVQKNIYGNRRR